MRKIDMHVHLTPKCITERCDLLKNSEDYWKMLAESPKNNFATAEDVVNEMDRCDIEKAVVFGFSFLDPALCREVNDYTIESVRKYPNRFVGYMAVSPAQPGLEAEMDRCLAAGLRGIGELFPAGQNLDLTDRTQTQELAGLSLERGLPVMVHANERVGHQYPGKVNTTPLEVSRLAENHPDNLFIFAHWGGGLIFYELMNEIRKCNHNVYYDTAASIFLYDQSVFRVVREIGVLEKVLFASDFPLVSPERYFEYIGNSGLTQSEQEQVYWGNAARLLGL